jgi:transcription elongation factor S-II
VSLADPVRERAAQMLAEALTPADDAAQTAEPTAADDFESDPVQTGAAIERALFDKHKGDTSKDYKQQMRSLYANLKNKKNPGLRKSIMVGELTPLEFVNMSVHDLADPELVEQRRKDAEWATKVAMGPALSQAAPTDAFVCPRCKQRKCRYIMLQTRSADEPMTTFITCANCGHHWRNG